MLKCSREVRHLTLLWLGDCLLVNANRVKLWNTQNLMGIVGMKSVSDGFMLNLGNVLLRLCEPLVRWSSEANDGKILKVDPTYCSAEVYTDTDLLKI